MCLPEKVQCHPHWPAWPGVGDTGLFPGEYPKEGTYYKTSLKVPYLWFLAPRHHENWWHIISGTPFSSSECFIRIHGVEVCKRPFHSFGGLTVPPWFNRLWKFWQIWLFLTYFSIFSPDFLLFWLPHIHMLLMSVKDHLLIAVSRNELGLREGWKIQSHKHKWKLPRWALNRLTG